VNTTTDPIIKFVASTDFDGTGLTLGLHSKHVAAGGTGFAEFTPADVTDHAATYAPYVTFEHMGNMRFLTTAQRLALTTVPKGTWCFDTDINKPCVFNGTRWEPTATGTD
jgi:hypothetical protein